MKLYCWVLLLLPSISIAFELTPLGSISLRENSISLSSFLSISNDGLTIIKRDTNYENNGITIYKQTECNYSKDQYTCQPSVLFNEYRNLRTTPSKVATILCEIEGKPDLVEVYSIDNYVVRSDRFQLEKLYIQNTKDCSQKVLIPAFDKKSSFIASQDVAFYLGGYGDSIFYMFHSNDSTVWDAIGGYNLSTQKYLDESYVSSTKGLWLDHAVISFSETGILGGAYTNDSSTESEYCLFYVSNSTIKKSSCHDILTSDTERNGDTYVSSALSKSGGFLAIGLSNSSKKEFFVKVYKVK